MSRTKLTTAVEKRVTSDWHAAFPAFGIYKPMWLLRRAGPLLMGIVLERDSGSDGYRPIFHVHDLANPFPIVSLTLPRKIRNEYVLVDSHASKFSVVAQRLAEIVSLPLSGPVTLAQVDRGFHAYLLESSNPYEPEVYRDLALICAWSGAFERAEEVAREAEAAMKGWPDIVLAKIGGLEAWLSSLRDSLRNREALHAITAAEIEKHRVGGVPAIDLG